MQLLYFITTDQPSSFSQAPSACGVQCSTERLVDICNAAKIMLLPAHASEQGNVIRLVSVYIYIICIICYSTGRSDIRDIFHEL